MKLSAVLITRNEARNLSACFGGLRFCQEIILVDSGSSDGTLELARSLGAKVYTNSFKDFASQKNFAISKANGDWVLLVDADERISPKLGEEIQTVLKNPSSPAFWMRRQNRIFGRWMNEGACRGDRQLRLVRKDRAIFKGLVHERIVVEGACPCLQSPLLHESTATIGQYMRKLNTYTSLEAQLLQEKNENFSTGKIKSRPFFLFLYFHFLKRGFLDDIEGFFFNGLSAYYEFVRRAKQWERSKQKEGMG